MKEHLNGELKTVTTIFLYLFFILAPKVTAPRVEPRVYLPIAYLQTIPAASTILGDLPKIKFPDGFTIKALSLTSKVHMITGFELYKVCCTTHVLRFRSTIPPCTLFLGILNYVVLKYNLTVNDYIIIKSN